MVLGGVQAESGGSHASPGSMMLFPQKGGQVQSELHACAPGQGVPPVPGSQVSPLSTVPLPQSGGGQVQLELQGCWSGHGAVSQASLPSTMPLPHYCGAGATIDGTQSSVGRVSAIVSGPNWLLMKIGFGPWKRGLRGGRTS